MARYIVDRVEGGEWVVLEDEGGRTFSVPWSWLPDGVQEGAVLKALAEKVSGDAHTLRFELDPSAREERLAKARRLRDQLPRSPKGDVSL